MKKTILFVLLIGLLTFFGLSLRTIPAPIPSNCSIVEGIVEEVFSPCCKDVVIKLKNSTKVYYFNRGLEDGLNVEQMKEDLIGKLIQLKQINHWTPLDPDNYSIPLAELLLEGSVYYTRMQKE